MTLEEYTEQYKKNLLLLTLRKGKTPKRHGLFWRLLDLMNSNIYYSSTIRNVTTPDGYDIVIDVYTHPGNLEKLLEKRTSKNVLDRHLKDYTIKYTTRGALIFFKREAISWAKLDYDLMESATNMNRKYYIKNGFVYRK